MFKKLSLAGAAIAMGATALVPATPALAQSRHYHGRHDYGRTYDNGYYDNGRVYRGRNGDYRNARRCNTGDTGTIVGAIAGGLLGRTVTGRNDHLLGTVLGAGAGALAGRAVERSDRPEYCRR
jgi:hypothetical protein